MEEPTSATSRPRFRVSASRSSSDPCDSRSVTPPPRRDALAHVQAPRGREDRVAGRSAAKISVRPGKGHAQGGGQDGFRGATPSRAICRCQPPRRATRRGAPGAGLGPVRADAEGAAFPTNATIADAATAAGRERRKSASVARGGDVAVADAERAPGWRPRARVPFREARAAPERARCAQGRALARAAGEGWAPTRAPEWNNPNGTGKAVRAGGRRATRRARPPWRSRRDDSSR